MGCFPILRAGHDFENSFILKAPARHMRSQSTGTINVTGKKDDNTKHESVPGKVMQFEGKLDFSDLFSGPTEGSRHIFSIKTDASSPRLLQTDFWEVYKPEEASNHADPTENRIQSNGIVETHWRLEVLEQRIQNETEKRYKHPAQVIEMDRHEKIGGVSKAELDLRTRYAQIEFQNIVPVFWKHRPWDSESNRLTEEKSSDLRAKIRNLSPYITSQKKPNKKTQIKSPKKEEAEISRKKKHQIRKSQTGNLLVQFSTAIYATDDSDEMTDF